MLNPSAHVHALFKKGLVRRENSKTTGLTLALAAGVKYVGYHTLLTSALTIAELIILYAYALGLLYTRSKFFSFLQCYILSPIVSCLVNVTGRLQLRGWMLIFIVHGIAQVVGHVTSTLVKTQQAELRAAQQAIAEKQEGQQRIVARHRPDALLDQLSPAAKDADNESDEIATKLTHGEINVAQFIATYLPQRNLYHERSLKLAVVHPH
ncbi:hypothetical protein PsorP6_002865 [Peronosclerospora sorghi]|uniref:Uncharacterized protein n=1 Tax=Peronosclerospora sorghi TaxID=230839 RepID=A0ACC0VMB0_9STRA|nr:hypothetical protein PsorP6_002865 [Peronosclerospora sorghi]